MLPDSVLARCPWGPVTANGVDLLTKIYQAHGFNSCGRRRADTWKDGKLGNII